MALGGLKTEGDLERFIDDRYGDRLEMLMRQVQDNARLHLETITGDGATVTFNVAHNFGTRDVRVTMYRDASPWADSIPAVERPDEDSVDITFGAAPALGVTYRVLVSR